MKLSQKNKLIMGGIGIALVLLGVLFLMFNPSKDTEGDKNLSNVIRIQQDHASLTGVVQVLDGEVIEGEEEGKTTFKAEGQEIITTIGSDVVMVNGEERPYVKETIQTEDNQEDELETNELPVVYEDEDEVFVPIEFVEDVFDLTYDEESLEFKKEDEVILVGEKTEEPTKEEEAESEVNSSDDEEKEENKEEEEQTEETEESKKDETVNSEPTKQENTTNQTKPENTNNSTSNTTKPENTGSSSNSGNTGSSNNSGSTGNSNNSGNAGNSNNQTKPETSTPPPTPTPEPQPVKVTSLTTSTGNLTLEVGGSAKMNVTVNPSNADNKGVTFTSSNTGVATVDGNGNIVAKGAGTASITAKSNENGNISVSITVTVNEKPKKAVYTGDTIVARLRNEKGWCGSGTSAYISVYGCNMAMEGWGAEIASVTSSDIDVQMIIKDSTQSGVVSGVESVIRWMMPNQGQQVINKLHDPNYYGGTLTNIDGRKVVISLQSWGITINIHAKYE